MSLQTRSMERTSNNDRGPSSLQYRIFIENLDSLLGATLVEEFRNDNENDVNPHIIIGDGLTLPRGATRLINAEDPTTLAQVIIDCDVIIFHTSIPKAEFAFKLLKHGRYVAPKIFILLSPAATWASTPPREKNDLAEPSRASIAESEPELPFLRKYCRFTEQDLHLRRIHGCEQRKHLESLILTCDKPNLHAYVLTHGILYGRGEEQLYSLFKTAWMNPELELPIQGDGNNVIPMIHVQDLAAIVNKTVILTPAEKYIFAIDYDTVTQKKLVTAIAQSVGKGLVKSVAVTGGPLTMNVWMKPTNIFEQDDQYIDAKKNPIMNWHSKEGLVKHILKVRDEFKLFRGLDTIKVVILGPTAAGKSNLASKVAEHYKIPHIAIKQLIHDVAQMQTELGELVRSTLQQVKDQMVAEAQAIFDAERKKKKVPKGQPEPVFDPSGIVPRLPDDVLIQVYRWRLEQNDAQNLGYVLDGFPKTADQAKSLFFEVDKAIESISPKGAILLEIPDDQVREKAKTLDPARYADDLVVKRLGTFRKNIDGVGELLKQFELKKVDAGEDAINKINEFITRNGPICVLQDEVEEETNFIEEQQIQQEEVSSPAIQQSDVKLESSKPQAGGKKKGDQLNKSVNESRISNKPDGKKLSDEQKQDMIRQQERELLDTRSQPLRQYLADNVVPFLTEALIEICEKQPQNPLEFLADYLEQRGNQLQSIGQ